MFCPSQTWVAYIIHSKPNETRHRQDLMFLCFSNHFQISWPLQVSFQVSGQPELNRICHLITDNINLLEKTKRVHCLVNNFSFIDSFIDSLIDWLIDWLIHWFIDSLIHWFIDSVINSLIDWLIDSFIHWFIHSFIHHTVGRQCRSRVGTPDTRTDKITS